MLADVFGYGAHVAGGATKDDFPAFPFRSGNRLGEVVVDVIARYAEGVIRA